jgi:hypothetical protein
MLTFPDTHTRIYLQFHFIPRLDSDYDYDYDYWTLSHLPPILILIER